MINFNKNYWFICLVVSTILSTSPASATVFKCKSANGETIYSSKKCVGNAEIFTLKRDNRAAPSEGDINKPAVDIYITSWCPYCKKAIAYLRSKNIAFNIYNIETDARAKSRKKQLAPDYAGIPLTVINGKILKGFSPSRFDQALNLINE